MTIRNKLFPNKSQISKVLNKINYPDSVIKSKLLSKWGENRQSMLRVAMHFYRKTRIGDEITLNNDGVTLCNACNPKFWYFLYYGAALSPWSSSQYRSTWALINQYSFLWKYFGLVYIIECKVFAFADVSNPKWRVIYCFYLESEYSIFVWVLISFTDF